MEPILHSQDIAYFCFFCQTLEKWQLNCNSAFLSTVCTCKEAFTYLTDNWVKKKGNTSCFRLPTWWWYIHTFCFCEHYCYVPIVNEFRFKLYLKTVTEYTESVRSEPEIYVLRVLKCHINLNNEIMSFWTSLTLDLLVFVKTLLISHLVDLNSPHGGWDIGLVQRLQLPVYDTWMQRDHLHVVVPPLFLVFLLLSCGIVLYN